MQIHFCCDYGCRDRGYLFCTWILCSNYMDHN